MSSEGLICNLYTQRLSIVGIHKEITINLEAYMFCGSWWARPGLSHVGTDTMILPKLRAVDNQEFPQCYETSDCKVIFNMIE